ncbi:hypothetical protein KBC70_01035 [Candidatus Woesebacteria bacterium]|nr:hypothetical protein [Candidatus Woesebacteria bacterium]
MHPALVLNALTSVAGFESPQTFVETAVTAPPDAASKPSRPLVTQWAIMPQETKIPKRPAPKRQDDNLRNPKGSTTRPRRNIRPAGHR